MANERAGHQEPDPELDSTAQSVERMDFEPHTTAAQEPTADEHYPQSGAPSREGTPPPLPPRRKHSSLSVTSAPAPRSSSESFRLSSGSARPPLVSKATTALSYTDVQPYGDVTKQRNAAAASRQTSYNNLKHLSKSGGESEDSASIRSLAPNLDASHEIESMLEDVLDGQASPAWRAMSKRFTGLGLYQEETLFPDDPGFENAFEREFDELEESRADGSNEEALMYQWRSKLKHFLILSSAGKPIYSRHGDDQLISNYIGIVQTIISFYQGAEDMLKSFTAGDARFVIMSKGPLNLMAISRLNESEGQLRTQLESLYMQILSTLTLPSMERMFRNRASTDLRRPLQGTETLLSALSDGFTRGSPSTLLSALECLRLRKTQRQLIDNTLLKSRSANLLYGLVVAGGRLVSVVRPKKHSLHPGDLLLIFNMLFEAGSVKTGGGENWIPLCLPGFNNTGFLYMYVSFLSIAEPDLDRDERPSTSSGEEDEIAILLISANRESFYEMRQMRDDLVQQLEKNGGLDSIRAAVKRGRLSCTDIVPGTVLRHFLYKSRGNVQFTMPSYEPHIQGALDRRRLMTLYDELHTHMHTRPTHLKIHHSTSTHNISLAWITPLFELYAIAPGDTSRAALAQAANKAIQWVRREEERVFIIGGAVF